MCVCVCICSIFPPNSLKGGVGPGVVFCLTQIYDFQIYDFLIRLRFFYSDSHSSACVSRRFFCILLYCSTIKKVVEARWSGGLWWTHQTEKPESNFLIFSLLQSLSTFSTNQTPWLHSQKVGHAGGGEHIKQLVLSDELFGGPDSLKFDLEEKWTVRICILTEMQTLSFLISVADATLRQCKNRIIECERDSCVILNTVRWFTHSV